MMSDKLSDIFLISCHPFGKGEGYDWQNRPKMPKVWHLGIVLLQNQDCIVKGRHISPMPAM
jgi:hypothetical protein